MWTVVVPSTFVCTVPDWLPNDGFGWSVWSIEWVWRSYRITDQKRLCGMSGGSVMRYSRAPSRNAPSASRIAMRYWEPMPVRRMHIAGVMPVYG